jgi:hypothetical protein
LLRRVHLIAAPRQRNTQDEKKAIKDGRIPDDWKDKPAKFRQKDRILTERTVPSPIFRGRDRRRREPPSRRP